ncbi:hypothetical protein FHS95_003473 [Sphingomonas naasensis]|uniref:Lipoprotein n=1 Tax=Sphingomonas naasensis TaxID=1344951 RepID=A0A4V3QWH6_9SPHN|nr:hypothetical protein [Sphingomonas naasensis]NIJ21762.1 hypothetical protein [Sphingomonas naasensis]TGX42532.1 hypothetical protein E5A74_11905 [Sphingomonas naasensis]
MTRLAILAALGLPLIGACAATTHVQPAAADAARAWNDKRAEPCSRLIDLCEDIHFVAPPPEAVSDLRCSGDAETATCTFRIQHQRCRARFERVANGSWAPIFRRRGGIVARCRDLPPS